MAIEDFSAQPSGSEEKQRKHFRNLSPFITDTPGLERRGGGGGKATCSGTCVNLHVCKSVHEESELKSLRNYGRLRGTRGIYFPNGNVNSGGRR